MSYIPNISSLLNNSTQAIFSSGSALLTPLSEKASEVALSVLFRASYFGGCTLIGIVAGVILLKRSGRPDLADSIVRFTTNPRNYVAVGKTTFVVGKTLTLFGWTSFKYFVPPLTKSFLKTVLHPKTYIQAAKVTLLATRWGLFISKGLFLSCYVSGKYAFPYFLRGTFAVSHTLCSKGLQYAPVVGKKAQQVSSELFSQFVKASSPHLLSVSSVTQW